ncbi:hypothetical protein GCM10011506_31520 [Marivirga lumbricoides]|uniref:Tetratricopeptide repeat protein n=1 Tax=Marivirga lumbricoides TaxID=1046115 RepID=A0A2T4DSD2_9BACT|nr:hypothetical protein C9994_05920 [Marivirga lumbricoides]GGC43625.1 hypothetical protein GCM10011506_31520 [Marivirga lumbricoides]
MALVYYEKDVFEASNQNARNIALLKKAYCYKHQKEFKEAASTIGRAYPQASNDSLKYLLGYEASLCHYLAESFSQAKLSLIGLRNVQQSAFQKKKTSYLGALINLEMSQWEEAKNLSLQISSSPIYQDSVKSLYTELAGLKLKDPSKAETLSYFIPGSGQMYAGKVFRGITSLVLQTGLLGFAGYSFLNGYYFSGTFTGVSLFYVFYMGGARHAEYLAQEYNKNKIAKVQDKIELFLLEGIKKEASL